MKEYLKVKRGKAGIQFFSSCGPVVRNLPLLQHDIKIVNDVATQPHGITHSPDALRYWCSMRQLLPQVNEPTDSDPFHLNKKPEGTVNSDYLLGGFIE